MGKAIPKETKSEVLQIVETFNERYHTAFQISFRGQFAYLSKIKRQISISNIFRERIARKMGIPIQKIAIENAPVIETKLGRLKYEGKMDNWSFAVFKYSREFYDPDDWMFPSSFELDGTIEGALRAGIEIYPD